jgi:hypothetical protein
MTAAPDLQHTSPRSGTARELLQAAIGHAVLAPSIRNTQPWRFELADDTLLLRADRSRALPTADPDHRELVMSCGAALFNLRTVLQHWGFGVRVQLMPDPHDPDLLARVSITSGRPSGDDYRALVAAMGARRTHRDAFSPDPLPQSLLDELAAVAQREGAWLVRLQPPLAQDAALRVGAAARQLLGSRAYRRESAAWLRFAERRAQDGVPVSALGLGSWRSRLGALLRRVWDRGSTAEAARQEARAREAPALVVLGTQGDTHRDWLWAGQALEHVLLVAANAGVFASFLDEPLQIPWLRRWLLLATGLSGAPQLLLRLGYGMAGRATPRRPVMEVLDAVP